MVDNLKENGSTIKDMVEVMKAISMVIFTKGNFNMVKHMGKVVINGSQVLKFTMVNGLRA